MELGRERRQAQKQNGIHMISFVSSSCLSSLSSLLGIVFSLSSSSSSSAADIVSTHKNTTVIVVLIRRPFSRNVSPSSESPKDIDHRQPYRKVN